MKKLDYGEAKTRVSEGEVVFSENADLGEFFGKVVENGGIAG